MASFAGMEESDKATPLVERAMKSMLALEVPYQLGSEPGVCVLSGFGVLREEGLFWVTAGHCIAGLADLRAHIDKEGGQLQLRWSDGSARPGWESVPTSIEIMPMPYSNDDLDIGVCMIHPHVARTLLANEDFLPFRDDEIEPHDAENQEWSAAYLCGYPIESNEDSISRTRDGVKLVIKRNCVLVPLRNVMTAEKVRELGLGEDDFTSKSQYFFATIEGTGDVEGAAIKSIAGMSGGPIVAQVESRISTQRFMLVGIQSSWIPKGAVIRALPSGAINLFIDQVLATAREQS